MDTIRQLIDSRNTRIAENENPLSVCHGWVRTLRESSSSLGFCNINDGSNIDGMQLIISDENMDESEVKSFFENVKLGAFLSCCFYWCKPVPGCLSLGA